MTQQFDPLTVAGTLKDIGQLTEYVSEAAEQAGLTERERYYLCLAVDEIATNVVMYGYQKAGISGELTIRAIFDDEQVHIELEDSGVTFDPRQVPEPDLHKPPHERPVGGLGIYLALHGIDRFQYARIKRGNRSTFIVHKSNTSEMPA